MREPLSCEAARNLIRAILLQGHRVAISRHALERMEERACTSLDATNVLRAGVVKSAELESGTWRYRVETYRMCVVVAFRPEQELVAVTVIRI